MSLLALSVVLPGDAQAQLPTSLTASFTNGANVLSVNFSNHPIRSANFNVLVQDASGALVPYSALPASTYLGTALANPGVVAAATLRTNGTMKVKIFFENGSAWRADCSTNGGTASNSGNAFSVGNFPDFTVNAGGAGSSVYAAELGVDSSWKHFDRAGQSVDATLFIIEHSVLCADVLFLRDVGIIHRIGRVVIRANQAQDPYNSLLGGTYLDAVRNQWNNVLPASTDDVTAGISSDAVGGGLAWVGVIGTSSAYSVNDSDDGDGQFDVVWRHEVGHNWGSEHYAGNSPEGSTIMSGNSVSRISSGESRRILDQRNSKFGILDNLGAYTFPLPPRAGVDRYFANTGTNALLDVMLNDHDANGNPITLASFDAYSKLGVPVTRSVGTGPGGRDQLQFQVVGNQGEVDYVRYEIVDSTGRPGTGVAYLMAETPSFKLTGTVIGSPGSWGNNPANTKTAAMDGNLNTFYDAVNGTGDWVGLDLGAGSTNVVSRIKFAPRSGFPGRMDGGVFQASSVANFSTDVITLFTISGSPTEGMLTTQTIGGNTPYRYVRYLGPANGFCNVAEIEFHGHSGAPMPPLLLTASPASATQVALGWRAPANVTSYNVKRATTSGGPYTTVGLNLTDSSFIDAGVTPGTPYYYVVTASNAYGESANSAEESVLITPYLWDADVATAGQQDGSGAWLASFNWLVGGANLPWADGNPAEIGAGTGINNTITLSSDVAPSGINFAGGAGTYTLTGPGRMLVSGSTAVTVGNNANLGAVMTGNGGLTKLGPGRLTLTGASTYLGNTIINAGTLALGVANALPTVSVIDNDAGLNLNGFNQTVGGLTGTGTVTNSGGAGATLTVNPAGAGIFSGVIANGVSSVGLTKGGGGTLTLSGANTYNGATTINGGTLTIAGTNTGGGSCTLDGGSLSVAANGRMTAGAIVNSSTSSSLNIAGGGVLNGTTLTMNYTPSAFTVNGTLNLSGALIPSWAATASITGTGTINCGEYLSQNWSTLSFSANTLNTSGKFFLGNNNTAAAFNQSAGTVNVTTTTPDNFRIGHWPQAGTYALSGGTLNALNIDTVVGWDGTGLLDISGSGVANLRGVRMGNTASAGIHNGPGTVTVAGRLNLGVSGMSAGGSGAHTVNLGAGMVGAFANWSSSLAMNLTDAATGATFNTLDSANGVTARTITLSGILSGVGRLNKAGAGTLVLSGNNTYAGTTTVSGGTLLMNGNNNGATGPVAVNAGGTLGGNGTIGGSLTLNAGATLSPGTSIGTLTASGNVTMSAGSTNSFEVNGSTSANDVVAVGGSVSYAGTLEIVPTGTFTTGQTFTLFSGAGAASASNFASLTGSPGAGKAFSFTNGVLSVVSTVVPPATLTNSVTGNTLQLSWPAGQGWRLEGQTNSWSVGLSTNWVPLTDASVSSTNLTIDPTKPTVFYRLVNP